MISIFFKNERYHDFHSELSKRTLN